MPDEDILLVVQAGLLDVQQTNHTSEFFRRNQRQQQHTLGTGITEDPPFRDAEGRIRNIDLQDAAFFQYQRQSAALQQ